MSLRDVIYVLPLKAGVGKVRPAGQIRPFERSFSGPQNSLFTLSSYISCFEMFFEEEICSSTSSEFFEDQEHILLKYIVKED